jgi:hypothetical protein
MDLHAQISHAHVRQKLCARLHRASDEGQLRTWATGWGRSPAMSLTWCAASAACSSAASAAVAAALLWHAEPGAAVVLVQRRCCPLSCANVRV